MLESPSINVKLIPLTENMTLSTITCCFMCVCRGKSRKDKCWVADHFDIYVDFKRILTQKALILVDEVFFPQYQKTLFKQNITYKISIFVCEF